MKYLVYVPLVFALALLSPMFAFAGNPNHHSVVFSNPVNVGHTQLKPGNYKVEWSGNAPNVQVTFQQNGKTIVTAPATLKTNENGVTRDDVIVDKPTANTQNLRELDFAHQKEALIFAQGAM